MSATPSPMSAASGSPRQSPRSNRSSSNERSPRKHSRSPSRTPTPENMSDRSRSPLGSPRSKGSRTPSLHSSDGEEVVQERKDIEDSGSEEEHESKTRSTKARTVTNGEDEPKDAENLKEGEEDVKADAEDAVGAEDIFGDDLSISSEDDDDKESKKAVIEDQDSNEDEHRDQQGVQRYGDDHPEGTAGESGSASASVSPKGPSRSRSRSRSRSKSPARYDDDKQADEDEDMEKEPEKAPEPVSIHVEVPKITTNLGKDLNFVKLPNFLSLDCKPFDPETYEDDIEDDLQLDEEGNARLKLKVENTIRWRQSFDSEGKAIKESNARIVKWSDGSTSLHLGNEIFDIHKQPLAGDYNHMFIRQGTGLQGQAIFRNKLSFRPHSTESFTHQKMTRKMAERHSGKDKGIKVISQVGLNPEIGKNKRVQEEEQRLRADLRRDSMVNRKKERATGRGLSKGYLEGGDSDEDGISLAKLKSQYKKGGKDYGKHTYSSEEDDSDVETKKAGRLEKAKAAIRDSEESGHSDAASVDSRKSRSRSQSPKSNASDKSRKSRSPVGSGRSRSVSRSKSRSRSISRSPSRSKSNSPANRSRSKSPNSGSGTPVRSGSESD